MLFEQSYIFERDPTLPHVHFPTLVELPTGELMSAWFAGTREGNASVCIKASWKPLSDGEWSPPTVIHKTPNKADGNPVLVWYQDKLFLFYTHYLTRHFQYRNDIVSYKTSSDYGHTWIEPKVVLPQHGSTVRIKPMVLGDRLLVPSARELIRGGWAQMLITEDGVNFHLSSLIKMEKGIAIQPSPVKLNNGDLLAFLRTKQGAVYTTLSHDLGENWDVPIRTELKNPYSSVDAIHTDQGEIFLVWNNNLWVGPKNGGRRAITENLKFWVFSQ